jgi:uncharacterized protein
MGAPPTDYQAILAKVDAFASDVSRRRAADLRCRPGCDHCCQVELSVCSLEAQAIGRCLAALPDAARQAIRDRARAAARGRCVMLGADGTCTIYEARPTVCRTQGLPLRYPKGFVPEEALVARLGEDGISWCRLNFTEAVPEPRDVLDAELVDTLVGLANQKHCSDRSTDPLGRVTLRVLAAE